MGREQNITWNRWSFEELRWSQQEREGLFTMEAQVCAENHDFYGNCPIADS